MKIEVGKFYRTKITNHKLLCIVVGDELRSSRFWDYDLGTDSFLEPEDIEEWKEPKTKEVWVYLMDHGTVYTSDEDPAVLRSEGVLFIGARKVTLVEGEWA